MQKFKIGDLVKVVGLDIWNKDVSHVLHQGRIEELVQFDVKDPWYKLEGDDVHRFYTEDLELIKKK